MKLERIVLCNLKYAHWLKRTKIFPSYNLAWTTANQSGCPAAEFSVALDCILLRQSYDTYWDEREGTSVSHPLQRSLEEAIFFGQRPFASVLGIADSQHNAPIQLFCPQKVNFGLENCRALCDAQQVHHSEDFVSIRINQCLPEIDLLLLQISLFQDNPRSQIL